MTNVTEPNNPMEEFKNSIMDKLKTDIAGLMPEDALKGLIERAVNDIFFKKEEVNTGTHYHPLWHEKPSWFETAVLEAAKPIIEKKVAEVVEQNKSTIDLALTNILDSERLSILLHGQMAEMAQKSAAGMIQEVIQRLHANGIMRY